MNTSSKSTQQRNRCKYLLYGLISTICLLFAVNIFGFEPYGTDDAPTLTTTFNVDASCLNDIFDAIFVISIRTRIPTLSITLKQLDEESIDYILWEGHSDYNPHSNEIFDAFTKDWCPNFDRQSSIVNYDHNSAYVNKHVFFVRQTQLDIFKYAKEKKMQKILLLEDDIILANPNMIHQFCEIESHLPNWDVLGLGINQDRKDEELQAGNLKLKNIPQHEEKFIKYYFRTMYSAGAFGLALSEKIFDKLLRAYDYETSGICTDVAVDALEIFVEKGMIQNIIGVNIYPTLILPDVTDSTHTEDLLDENLDDESVWIKRFTLIENAKFFSKYYDLRFGKMEKEKPQDMKNYARILELFNAHKVDAGIKSKSVEEWMDLVRRQSEEEKQRESEKKGANRNEMDSKNRLVKDFKGLVKGLNAAGISVEDIAKFYKGLHARIKDMNNDDVNKVFDDLVEFAES